MFVIFKSITNLSPDPDMKESELLSNDFSPYQRNQSVVEKKTAIITTHMRFFCLKMH